MPTETPSHFECQYLDLLRRVWEHGDERRDRTGVGTRSLFGPTMRFSLAGDEVPLLTTKRVAWKTAAREMLWFLTGDTNIRDLVRQNVHIWTDWPLDRYRRETGENIDRASFEARILEDEAFAQRWGDLGPVYGKQWVNWDTYGGHSPEPDVTQIAVHGLERRRTGRHGASPMPHDVPVPRRGRAAVRHAVATIVRSGPWFSFFSGIALRNSD